MGKYAEIVHQKEVSDHYLTLVIIVRYIQSLHSRNSYCKQNILKDGCQKFSKNLI